MPGYYMGLTTAQLNQLKAQLQAYTDGIGAAAHAELVAADTQARLDLAAYAGQVGADAIAAAAAKNRAFQIIGDSDISKNDSTLSDMGLVTPMTIVIPDVIAGSKIRFDFDALFRTSIAGQYVQIAMLVDNAVGTYSVVRIKQIPCSTGTGQYGCNLSYTLLSAAAGTVKVKMQWAAVSGTKYQDGITYNRNLSAIVLGN